MLSIGEIAHATGVSRRMLRHWEDAGLVAPASVDEHTGYRRYARTQVGRVRAIAALRSVGFSLADIGALLDHSQLTESRLVELLQAREHELTAQIYEASTRLTEVRQRLHAIQRGHDVVMSTIQLQALPTLHLRALQETVTDESEIGEAVSTLLPRLRAELERHGTTDGPVVLIYDGTDGADTIVVTAGSVALDDAAPGTALSNVEIRGCDRGVTVRFEQPPADIGDAWISLDRRLEDQALETTGVYRQVVEPDGVVVLQAEVRALRPDVG
jgi:DNA-binding transcriptional MerR regulator